MNDGVLCMGCAGVVDYDDDDGDQGDWASSSEDSGERWPYYCRYCHNDFCSETCMEERMPVHAKTCRSRDRRAMEGVSDPEELAVVFGVCSAEHCISRVLDGPLPNGCPMCGKRLWCSNKDCMIGGLQQHYQICEERQRRHEYLQARGEFTPRSGIGKLWRSIEGNAAVARRLYHACRSSERKSAGAPGVMVLAEDTLDAVCDAINTVSLDEVELFKFMPVRMLMDMEEQGVTTGLRPLWEARLLVGSGFRAMVLGVVYGVGEGKVCSMPRIIVVPRRT